MSADFWGLKTAGGTATAYHLLAGVLATNQSFQVTYVAPCLVGRGCLMPNAYSQGPLHASVQMKTQMCVFQA